MRKMSLRIAGALLLVVTLAGLLIILRQRQLPLSMTSNEPFVFEQHARVLNVVGKRPAVAATVAGGLYLLSTENGGQGAALSLRMSHDGGEHWIPPIPLSMPGAVVTTSAENAPQLAARSMYAFALWQEKNSLGTTQLRLARSSGMDAKPPASAQIIDKPENDTSYSGFASLTLAPTGDVYAVWLDGRDQTSATGTFNVYLARSTDRGLTFHHNVRVATLACPCCRPSVAIGADGKVYVAYRRVFGDNERDIAVTTSSDSGEHFSDPIRVSPDRWKLFGCPESGPVVATQGSKFVVAWYTAADDHPGIRLSASADGGNSFSHPLLISRNIQSANHPYLTSSEDGTIAVVFSGRSPTQTGTWDDVSPFIFRISPEGRVSSPVRVPYDKAGDRYATVSLAPDGDTYVTWSTTEEAKIYLARASTR